jgi:hypothetical protein
MLSVARGRCNNPGWVANEGLIEMSKKGKSFDLYTFVAGASLETGKPFLLRCNCEATVTIMPPFEDEFVVCPRCEATIRMLVIEGDPGYVFGADASGNPTLLPVQGSSHPHPHTLTTEERRAILAKAPHKTTTKDT